MTKKWTGFAAAALTASLTLGGLGTTYGATLTLAGFGADIEVGEKEAQKKTETAKNEAVAESSKTKADKKTDAAAAEATEDKASAEGQSASDATDKLRQKASRRPTQLIRLRQKPYL